MSKRAEQRALEAYSDYTINDIRLNYEEHRRVFVEGYTQAEQDLVLTIDDIERIHTFLYAVKNNKTGQFTFTRLSDEQYQEVLRRFNTTKKD